MRMDDRTPVHHVGLLTTAAVRTSFPPNSDWRPSSPPPAVRIIHGYSRSATVHSSASGLNGQRLAVVVVTLAWRNGSLMSTRSDDVGA